jgi:hypothetical protein
MKQLWTRAIWEATRVKTSIALLSNAGVGMSAMGEVSQENFVVVGMARLTFSLMRVMGGVVSVAVAVAMAMVSGYTRVWFLALLWENTLIVILEKDVTAPSSFESRVRLCVLERLRDALQPSFIFASSITS